jgi:hypothetical protein
MTTSQTEKLESLRNFGTRYELVLERGAERFRLCYTGRKNRRGMIDAIFRLGAELGAFTGQKEVRFGKGATAQLGDWAVRFSGRTQREAIIAGELAWFSKAE